MDFKNKTVAQIIGTLIGQVAVWFLSAVFIWWGWNIFAGHFNLPQFEYMEVFAMRMALTFIMKILWQKTETRDRQNPLLHGIIQVQKRKGIDKNEEI